MKSTLPELKQLIQDDISVLLYFGRFDLRDGLETSIQVLKLNSFLIILI